MHKIKPGDTEVIAEDYETGDELHIPLNPALSAAENLKVFFKRYHKGLTGANMLGQQIEVVRSTLSDVHRLLSEFEQLNGSGLLDASTVLEFAQRGTVKRILAKYYPESRRITKPPKSKPKKKDVPSKLMPRRYATADGLEVWVGKSDEGNDYLSTKLADGNDLFFHLEGWPGSHVVLRLSGRKDPPPDALLDACELAVFYSKQKGASRANVHVAAIKDVKKPSGAKPGLVYVNRGKTIALRADPKRLERVLGAVIKEETK
jgi:predicted ribosome quality control (RQC) complex YloA/Tae2 family protein